MTPRPWAEVGLALLPRVFVATPIALSAGGDTVLQASPIAVANASLGVLLLCIRTTTERRAAEHTTALTLVNRRLETLNGLDPLTGLANRRTLDESLSRAWSQGRLTDRPVGFLMIDIDHFKDYNDHCGHPGGDSCLRLIAATIADSVRGTDLVARYGGEEFSILLPGADLIATYRLAERVRAAVEQLRLEHAAAPERYLSVSVGAAAVIPGVDDPEDLVREADRSLYAAKRQGHNRVCV